LLGLELLLAADIIGTVSIAPSFESLAVLACIALIRTFLSFAIETELEGRWPWRRQSSACAQPERSPTASDRGQPGSRDDAKIP